MRLIQPGHKLLPHISNKRDIKFIIYIYFNYYNNSDYNLILLITFLLVFQLETCHTYSSLLPYSHSLSNHLSRYQATRKDFTFHRFRIRKLRSVVCWSYKSPVYTVQMPLNRFLVITGSPDTETALCFFP